MALTKEKYNQNDNTFFEQTGQTKEVVEKLGFTEKLLNKYNIEGKNNEETAKNLERLILLGLASKKRIERLTDNKVYFIAGRKTRRAVLRGFSEGNYPLDYVIIEKNGFQTQVPFSDIYISRKEARRQKKGLQRYPIDAKHYDYFFKGEKFAKHTFLMETKKASDEFMIYTKVFRAYYRKRSNKVFTLEELKKTYFIDIEKDYKGLREKYLKRQKKY